MQGDDAPENVPTDEAPLGRGTAGPLWRQRPQRRTRRRAAGRTRWKSASWSIAALASMVTLVLSLLGFGVALASENLGLPFAVTAASPFDFLSLSVIAVIQLWEGLPTAPQRVLQLGGAKAELIICASACCAIFVLHLRRSARTRAQADRSPRRRAQADTRLSRARAWLLGQSRRVDWRVRSLVASVLLTLGLRLGVMVANLALLFGIGVALYALSIVPIIGFEAGKSHIVKYVVEPLGCALPVSRVDRLSSVSPRTELGATCVVACRAGSVLGKGRVAFSNATSLTLYDPDGAAARVPIAGATVHVVGSLDADADALCAGRPRGRLGKSSGLAALDSP